MRKNDRRNRLHASYLAFVMHRLSGVVLALFLPLHFWALSLALKGDTALNQFMAFTSTPLFKFGEWGLAVLLTVHMVCGIRLLLIDFRTSSPPGLLKSWVTGAIVAGCTVGVTFFVSLVY